MWKQSFCEEWLKQKAGVSRVFFSYMYFLLSFYLSDFTEYYYPSEFSSELETSEHTEIHYVHFLTGVLKFSFSVLNS